MSKKISGLSKSDVSKIEKSISEAEKETSGEIRVHLIKNCEEDIYTKAIEVFNTLGMGNTQEKNGILLLISFYDRKLAILGDKAINEKLPENFWNETKEEIISYFKLEQYLEGICYGVNKIGAKLKSFFPIKPDDINELDNEVTFS